MAARAGLDLLLIAGRLPVSDKYNPRQDGSFASPRRRKGTQVLHNRAPRTEQSRFISAWHAQSELQGQVCANVKEPHLTLLHVIFVVLISQDQNPGPQYKNRSTLGPKNAPAFGFGSSKAHDADSQVFISATHAKENQGADGPGPGAYSPRMPTTPRSGSRHFVVSALS